MRRAATVAGRHVRAGRESRAAPAARAPAADGDARSLEDVQARLRHDAAASRSRSTHGARRRRPRRSSRSRRRASTTTRCSTGSSRASSSRRATGPQTGAGGPATTVDVPPGSARYTKGVVAMAKSLEEPPGSAGSQFFVVTADDAQLDGLRDRRRGHRGDGRRGAHRRARRRGAAADAARRHPRRSPFRKAEWRSPRSCSRPARRRASDRPSSACASPRCSSGWAGPRRRDRRRRRAYELELPEGTARVVKCKEWSRGPGASLRCGLAALGPDVDAAIVVLADGPDLVPESVARVLETWRDEGGVVAASYDGARGHPLVVGRAEWDDVPDRGLRATGAPRALRRPRGARRRRHACRPSAAARELWTATRLRRGREAPRASP